MAKRVCAYCGTDQAVRPNINYCVVCRKTFDENEEVDMEYSGMYQPTKAVDHYAETITKYNNVTGVTTVMLKCRICRVSNMRMFRVLDLGHYNWMLQEINDDTGIIHRLSTGGDRLFNIRRSVIERKQR